VYYSPVIEAMNDLIGHLTDHFCSQSGANYDAVSASCESSKIKKTKATSRLNQRKAIA